MVQDLKYLLSSAFFKMPGVWDIVDILIIAVVIYKLTDYLRRTSTARVARGILLLIAFLWLSSILKLRVVNYLLGKTLEMGFLAVIILFQPELRRILESVGSSNIKGVFGWRGNEQEIVKAIAQTVLACEEMSRTKTGALIIFEREIQLDDPIKTGTIVNADVTSELVKNIFFNKAPLHDGAVIVRNGRIVGAGCMLPLSGSVTLSRALGMRHRAAIGVSEQSDALAVVVSEETGSISVAVEGSLKRHLSLDTFEMLLRKELIRSEDETKKTGFRNKLKGKIYAKKNR